ncbi:hypothetical protein KAR91_73840 [Candidatus Pacearchaeota archaeon]|nr:hypothetical protein [Candidatus Pacearchaeota archaeon]
MQNYKIKKMSDKELKEQLKAVGSLLYYYQKGKDFPDDCPLCDVAGEYHPRCSRTCDYCLWEIIEDEDCSDFSYRKFKKISAAYLTDTKKWHTARIPMLRRWKKILKIELARRNL